MQLNPRFRTKIIRKISDVYPFRLVWGFVNCDSTTSLVPYSQDITTKTGWNMWKHACEIFISMLVHGLVMVLHFAFCDKVVASYMHFKAPLSTLYSSPVIRDNHCKAHVFKTQVYGQLWDSPWLLYRTFCNTLDTWLKTPSIGLHAVSTSPPRLSKLLPMHDSSWNERVGNLPSTGHS